MHGFSFDVVSAVIAYGVSVLGSALGLLCTSRARAAEGVSRARWLGLAATSIGGTGIWVMHFIAMLGSEVHGTPLRYDAATTILSMILAILVVAVGLFTVGFKPGTGWLLVGGAATGAGVAIMHYVGMAAIDLYGEVHYDPFLVFLSVVIAIVAATAALWATVNIKAFGAILVAALIMGIAVNGMHHVGMAAAEVMPHMTNAGLRGMNGRELLLPLVVGISFVTVMTLAIVTLSPNAQEIAEERALQARIARATGFR
nr:MHYT domain-containing protein [Kibdelosporangium sp. MJ126-NF4]CEL18265.1 putative integral membrane protein [Kibdelosporangium sp. MJ126-NF4]CTQ97751.1 putative integral membrane protein [Kibdelosporangium sp. MJ126-NF4]